MERTSQTDVAIIATLSYGKRVRIPERVLNDMDLKIGDLMLFRKKGGVWHVVAGTVVERVSTKVQRESPGGEGGDGR